MTSVVVSVVICAHNPEEGIFQRCLDAVAKAQLNATEPTEVIIVDNDSVPPLAERAEVGEFLCGHCARHLVHEPQAGLTSARIAGFNQAGGDTIIFIDDDNLPGLNYIEQARRLLRECPQVGVCGPGVIEVTWQEGSPKWAHHYRAIFQAKTRAKREFGRVADWPDYYPPGTGMIVRREIMARYAQDVRTGRVTVSDRKGSSLASAGDGQIVWTGVKLGYAAGTSPELELVHFISKRKARLRYMLRLLFTVMSDGQVALVESFPEKEGELRDNLGRSNLAQAAKQFLQELMLLRVRSAPMRFVSELGMLHGRYRATKQALPAALRFAAKLLS